MIRIVSVIETKNGIISSVNSFVINNDNEEGEKVKLMLNLFTNQIKHDLGLEWAKLDEESKEVFIEDGYYENRGYELSIVWSENVF